MTSLSGIRAISFDVDGTLWDFDRVMRESLETVLSELGRYDPEAAATLSVEKLIDVRARVHDDLRGVVTNLNEIRRQSFSRALREIRRPNESLASRLADTYFRSRDAGRMPFDDVRPALRALRRKYRLGLVSNGNTNAQAFGLENLISFEVFAQDHAGIEKPDPKIFQIALEKAGCRADELAHVGDSLDNDIVGAKNMGIKSIWLNRNGRELPQNAVVEHQITSLAELEPIL